MKALFTLAAAAFLFVVAPSTCLAIWDVLTVTPEVAKEMGMEVRSKAGSKNQVSVELEFPLAGELGRFSEVTLQAGQSATAPLKEDRSKPGRVVVRFWVNRGLVEATSLTVSVPGMPGTTGGTNYEVRVKDFVILK